jgi:predicted lipoprotein
VQYGEVSSFIDSKVRDTVLSKLPKKLKGKTLSFYGAFTLDKLSDITITPVALEVRS